MSAREVLKPIHTAAVGLANLRFFQSPHDGPRQPWHSVEDLYRCLSMDRSLRRMFLAKLKRDWKNDVRTVRSSNGPTTIAPHFMAQGIIDCMIEMGVAPANFDVSYAKGAAGAMTTLTSQMDPAASVNWAIAAYRNESGIPGPHPVMAAYPDGRGGTIIRAKHPQ